MKLWLIALLAVGILGLGGIVMATSSGFQDTTETQDNTKTVGSTNCGYEASQDCPYRNQGCDAQNNCDIESCAAVQGTGSCNCGN